MKVFKKKTKGDKALAELKKVKILFEEPGEIELHIFTKGVTITKKFDDGSICQWAVRSKNRVAMKVTRRKVVSQRVRQMLLDMDKDLDRFPQDGDK